MVLDEDQIEDYIAIIDDALREYGLHVKALSGTSRDTISIVEYETRHAALRMINQTVSDNVRKVTGSMGTKSREELNVRIDKFREEYFTVVSAVKTRILEMSQEVARPEQPRTSNVKGPKIELPTFDGSFEKWLRFKCLFESLVHEQTSLSDIEKFQYLQLSMKLPAGHANVLDNYKLCSEDYEDAWKAVCDRYNDKRRIISIHVNAMLSIKKMSCEAPSELRRVLDTFSSNLNALKQLGYDIGTLDDFGNMIIVQMVVAKLDDQTLKEWRKFIKDDCATWPILSEFLVVQWRSLDENAVVKRTSPEVKSNVRQSRSMVVNKTGDFKCILCYESHGLWNCTKFKGMTVDDRFKVVKDKKLCMNCFSKAHAYKNCPSKHACKTCNKRHHTMLHFSSSDTSGASMTGNADSGAHQESNLSPLVEPFRPFNMNKSNTTSCTSATNSGHTGMLVTQKQTLLSTVRAQVQDADGHWHTLTGLLDQGSDTNHITLHAAKLLNLSLNDACIMMTGIGEQTSVVRYTTKALVSSRYGPFKQHLEFSVMSSITGKLPMQSVKLSEFQVPEDIFLADPQFHQSKQIDMLLNSEVFYEALLGEKITLRAGPKLVHTKFGWIVGGTMNSQTVAPARSLLSCFAHTEHTKVDFIDKKLEAFIEADNFEPKTRQLTPEERYCEELFKSTTTRGADGKVTVRMPFKYNYTELGMNLNSALHMVYAQESRRRKDDVFNRMYIEYMQDLIDSGHMEEVTPDDSFAHYLPHHAVLKMSSTTTKLRPVCNASSKSETGLSLNDVMCAGPVVQSDMFDILLRARESKFVVMADITKMYRQIWVHPSQRKYLRVLWRADSTSEAIKHYQLKTVTFGTTCAPFLATRTLIMLADEYEDVYPKAAYIIRKSSYVDDFCFGVDTIEEGLMVRDQLRHIFASAGMTLCKFAANAPELLANLEENFIESSPDDDDNNTIKALGVTCELKTDQYSYRLKPMVNKIITKASVLSEIASIFDPIGWLGPVVLQAKLFMKRLWLHQLEWNQELPDELKEEWREFQRNFPFLSSVRINRHCYIVNHESIEIHGFSDASIEAYGAAVYVRSTDKQGNVQISLICAKSRVAPKKQKSLARLELCGALLLAKLVTRIVSVLSASINGIILWCDSTIVLNWITMLSSRLQTFVGNRVAAIQELSENFQWNHISGSDNPADIISRGLMPQEIQDCELWWNGPAFLQQPKSSWPKSIITVNENDPEVAGEMKKVSLTVRQSPTMLNYIETRYSEHWKIVKVMSYVKRFIFNCKNKTKRLTGPVTTDEREKAELDIIRVIQRSTFTSEYEILVKQREISQKFTNHPLIDGVESTTPSEMPQISKQSRIISLMPIMDDNMIMRVGGRLQNCDHLTEDQKHPILLPDCRFATRLIRKLHFEHHHPTQQTMMNILRQRFWILKAKILIKEVTRHCLTCYKVKPIDTHQLMAPLPSARVTMTPPFTNTALDYAGFFLIRSGTTRNAPKAKVYVAMFKCMCTGAIHLDLASDLSTNAFIDTLDRFISRRGLCVELYTDNATCFEGADNELKKILTTIHPDAREYVEEKRINWKFTTPRASHAGGIYESGIKSMKHHLKRLMGDRCFTFEQFQTVLCKIEAVLNSRPLTPMSDDPNDLQALTPGHFLIGRPLVAKPERNLLPANTSRLNKWEQVQQVQQQFWQKWYQDYLQTLQTRPKNFQEKVDFAINDMVIVKDSNLPPQKWVLGRIIKLFPDKSRVVRNVRVRTPTGEKDRHVKYLCLLPMEKSS